MRLMLVRRLIISLAILGAAWSASHSIALPVVDTPPPALFASEP